MSCSCCKGTSGLASPVDLLSVGAQQAAALIQALPEGDAVALLKSLPENVVRQICTDGVQNEINAYLPYIGLAAGAVALYFILK